jgi:hypothetical protein
MNSKAGAVGKIMGGGGRVNRQMSNIRMYSPWVDVPEEPRRKTLFLCFICDVSCVIG